MIFSYQENESMPSQDFHHRSSWGSFLLAKISTINAINKLLLWKNYCQQYEHLIFDEKYVFQSFSFDSSVHYLYHFIFIFKQTNYSLLSLKYLIIYMMSETNKIILNYFDCPIGKYKRYIKSLIKECSERIGQIQTYNLQNEWRQLSAKLYTTQRLDSLKDKNHRQLLIEYIKSEAVQLYNHSYFNNAKIDDYYIEYLREEGPFNFSEIIIIINQLKLIYKYYKDKMIFKRTSQNHTDMTIMMILQLCKTKERHINNNLNKFKCITQFKQNRQELIKQLGKMLRYSWVLEKKYARQRNQNLENQNSISQRNFSQLLEIQINSQRCYSILNSSLNFRQCM